MNFTPRTLTKMRATQTAHMMDTCTLIARTPGPADDFNNPTWIEVEAVGIVCGFDPHASREIMTETQLPVYDARLRLAIDEDVNEVSRVLITHRFGEMLSTPQEFEVLGLPIRGPSGLVLNLRTVTRE